MKHNIKVGILLDSGTIPAWQYHLLEQLLASKYITIELLMYSGIRGTVSSTVRRESFLYAAFKRRETKTQAISPDACESRNVEDLIPNINEISFGEPDQYPRNLKEIESDRLDVILALGDLSRIDTLCKVTRFGIWFFQHSYGQARCPDGSSVGFWEVIKRRPFVYSALMIRRSNSSAVRIAYDSYTGIDHFSHLKTRNSHLWKILFFVPRTLRRLNKMGGDQFWSQLTAKTPASSDRMINDHLPLTNSDIFLPLVSYVIWRLARRVQKKFYAERWILMFSLGNKCDDLEQYQAIQPPSGRFWADPFVLHRDGTYYIFIEDASMKDGRGRISLITMDNNGKYSPATTIIDRPYHLSYPFVFSWQNELYLVPESAENQTIEVYRCDNFPFEWRFETYLMENLSAYDTTLLEHNGIWWLFANLREHMGASTWDELCLFYSDNPLSQEWCAHPMNPVISDVRCARPAGRIFLKDGRMYRPSQDSSFRYGYGLNINEIVELSKTTYRETIVRTLEPKWDRSTKAVHTFSQAEELVMLDAIYRSHRYRRIAP